MAPLQLGARNLSRTVPSPARRPCSARHRSHQDAGAAVSSRSAHGRLSGSMSARRQRISRALSPARAAARGNSSGVSRPVRQGEAGGQGRGGHRAARADGQRLEAAQKRVVAARHARWRAPGARGGDARRFVHYRGRQGWSVRNDSAPHPARGSRRSRSTIEGPHACIDGSMLTSYSPRSLTSLPDASASRGAAEEQNSRACQRPRRRPHPVSCCPPSAALMISGTDAPARSIREPPGRARRQPRCGLVKATRTPSTRSSARRAPAITPPSTRGRRWARNIPVQRDRRRAWLGDDNG